MTIKKELLEILACPKCKKSVELSDDDMWLACQECSLKYKIKDGIPVMLIDEASPL